MLFNGNNNPVYETAKETLMYRTVLWTLWERERVGRFGRIGSFFLNLKNTLAQTYGQVEIDRNQIHLTSNNQK